MSMLTRLMANKCGREIENREIEKVWSKAWSQLNPDETEDNYSDGTT